MRVNRNVTIHEEIDGLGTVRVILDEDDVRSSLVLTCSASPLTIRVQGWSVRAVVALGMEAIREAARPLAPEPETR